MNFPRNTFFALLLLSASVVSTACVTDEIGVSDQTFLDPQDYDFAFNHMTDTQFLSEGFRDVFRWRHRGRGRLA